jgi:hypothetical protein
MNNRNHWITFANDTIARWGAFLPAPLGNPEALIRFGAGIAEAGERNAVFRPVHMPGAEPFHAGSRTFGEYLRQQVHDRGRIPIFPADMTPGPDLWTPARLAFYRNDDLVEEEIGDAGALLRELRPDEVETCRMFMRAASPVTVLGDSIPLDWAREVRVQLRLDTDIWFPSVMGMLEDIPEEGLKPDRYDNRELALRHTPRLNAFLAEIRQLALEAGGRWEVLDVGDLGVNYAGMWDASGVLL